MTATPVTILRRSFRIFSGRGARFLGAAVAFYAIASIAPLFVVILHAVGAIFGRPTAENTLFQSLGHWLAPEGVEAVRQVTLKLDASEKTHTVAGVLLVLYASTRLFRSLKRALNHLWSIDAEAIERERKAPVRYAHRYATALVLLALVIIVISAITATKVAIALFASYGRVDAPALLVLLDWGLSLGATFVLFFAFFKLLPEEHVDSREAATGAALSMVLFALGSAAITAYVRHKLTTDLYGGATTLVMGVLWVYYTAQVFFFGASVIAAMREVDRAQLSGAAG